RRTGSRPARSAPSGRGSCPPAAAGWSGRAGDMLSGVTPLYMHLDPRLLATPEHTTPGARAFALLGPNYGWTVLWKDDAWDGATSLDEAIACAVSIARSEEHTSELQS